MIQFSEYWIMIDALLNDLEPLNGAQIDFLQNCRDHMNPYTDDELTKKQKRWIRWMYQKHILNQEGGW